MDSVKLEAPLQPLPRLRRTITVKTASESTTPKQKFVTFAFTAETPAVCSPLSGRMKNWNTTFTRSTWTSHVTVAYRVFGKPPYCAHLRTVKEHTVLLTKEATDALAATRTKRTTWTRRWKQLDYEHATMFVFSCVVVHSLWWIATFVMLSNRVAYNVHERLRHEQSQSMAFRMYSIGGSRFPGLSPASTWPGYFLTA